MDYHQNVKQFGSKSGLTCKQFAKVINRMTLVVKKFRNSFYTLKIVSGDSVCFPYIPIQEALNITRVSKPGPLGPLALSSVLQEQSHLCLHHF